MMWFAATKVPPVEVNVAIYRLHVVVFCGWSLDEMIQWGVDAHIDKASFDEHWRRWIRETIDDNANGFCAEFGRGNKDVLIWLKTKPEKASEYGTLWHELSHAVDRIANQCDPRDHFFAGDWSSEPRAYLYEYLAVEITKELWGQ